MAVYKSKKATKDGRQYFFRIKYKDIYGDTHDYSSPKFKKASEAKEEEARFRVKISNKEAFVTSITLKQSFEELYNYKCKFNKKQTWRKDVNLFKHLKILENEKINNITLNKYKLFLNELVKKDLSIEYKNKILGLFKQIIRFSKKNHNTSDVLLNYTENLRDANNIKSEMLFFTYEEYKKFDSVIDDFEYHTFYEILYFLGTRQGEAQALTWNDVDFEKNEIKIRKTLTSKIKGEKWTISSPKTKSSIRNIPMPYLVLNDIKIMFKNAKKYSDFSMEWFIFGNAIPFKETTIQSKKNKYCKLAKVKQIRIHDFRHSCASLLINNGANIALVSKYLGHSNLSVTLNTYTHMFKSELERMTEILNDLK